FNTQNLLGGEFGNKVFHIGANEGQALEVLIKAMNGEDIGVEGLEISGEAEADAAFETMQVAVNQVSTQRSDLGAIQNRLEHTINNLGASSENLTAAEARIRDTDHTQVA